MQAKLQKKRHHNTWIATVVLLTTLFVVTLVLAAPPIELDPSFSGDGIVVADVGGFDNLGYGIVTQPDLKTIVSGQVINPDDSTDLLLLRYSENGSLDNSFGTSGQVISTVMDIGYGVALQQDGKIVVVGSKSNGGSAEFTVARFNADGTIDTTFGTNGVVMTAIGSGSSEALAVVLQFDGKIITAGYSENTSRDFALARYTADGLLDTTFGTNGTVETDFPTGLADQANSVALQLDGKIILAGSTHSDRFNDDDDVGMARYNPDGTLDTTFGEDSTGLVATPVAILLEGEFPHRDDGAFSVTIQSDGNIVVAGYATVNPDAIFVAIMRYTVDGVLDETYGGVGEYPLISQPGITTNNLGDGRAIARGVSIQTDGKSILGSSAEVVANPTANEGFIISRYDLNGTRDGGKVINQLDLAGAQAVALQYDGKIVVTGYAEPTDSLRTATVRLISGAPLLAVDPNVLNYDILSTGAPIQSKSFSVSGYNATDPDDLIRWSATTTVPWLTLNQSNGVGDAIIQATVDATDFSNDEYTGRIIVFAGSATRQEIVVTMNVVTEINVFLPIVLR